MSEIIETKKWYDKKFIVIILILFIPPIGLYALFKGNHGKLFKISFFIIGFLFTLSFIATLAEDEKVNKVEMSLYDEKECNTDINESDNEDLKKLKKVSSGLLGSGQINRIELINNKASIIYVSSFEKYKENQPQSMITSKEMNSYWTDKSIEKALVDTPVRIMKKLDFINEVEVIMPLHNKIILVKKSELEEFIGFTLEEIRTDWNNKFSNPYLYDNEGRKKFIDRFCKNLD